MKIINTPMEFVEHRKTIKNQSVGFVPTMGALHRGHESLLVQSRNDNDISVLSIFVNPTQFNDPKDLKNYPITLEQDLVIANKSGVDLVFLPHYESVYPDGYQYKIIETELSKKFCGANRPGHFDGVLTVVMKLLQIVRPHKSYFGEKDFQQLQLIKNMVKSFFIDTEIISMPTIREEDGLAKSSRNVLLTIEERILAPRFNKILSTSSTSIEAKNRLEAEMKVTVDYVEDYITAKVKRRLAAVRLGSVRLIDNVEI